MKLFHGTSADAAKKILRNGFKTDAGGAVWHCSGEAIYFWSPDELIEKGEADEESDAEYFARSRAFESAQCALPGAQDCRTVVFEVELSNAESVSPDASCEGMGGAVCTFENVPASAIRRVWVSQDLSLLKGFFLGMMHGRDLANFDELTDVEEKIVNAMKKMELYPEEIELLAGQMEFSPQSAKEII
jgi:hypothetical protein